MVSLKLNLHYEYGYCFVHKYLCDIKICFGCMPTFKPSAVKCCSMKVLKVSDICTYADDCLFYIKGDP